MVKKEKLKYWHLIKRDVLKHKKEIATLEAAERVQLGKCLTKWLHQIMLRQIVEQIYERFQEHKKIEELKTKMMLIVC